MSTNDLTRWNRSGLTRLRYVDGNAATHLERIRAVLKQRFPHQWQERLVSPDDGSDFEQEEEWIQYAKNQHLLNQYLAERGDIGWELVRAFARSCHVLTEHLNAHTNETFLRTATQWDNVRKMVSMLDYHPAGATSATTLLAIIAKTGTKGKVAKGLQVRHRPISGDRPIVFETLEDLEINEEFNKFQIYGWDRSQKELVKAEQDLTDITKSPWYVSPKAPVKKDESTLIVRDSRELAASAARVAAKKGNRILLDHEVGPEEDSWKAWTLGQVKLKSSPRFKRKPWLNGETVRRATKAHGIAKEDIIVWRVKGHPEYEKWRFSRVKMADALGLKLSPFSVELKKRINRDDNIYDNEYMLSDEWPDWKQGDIEIKRATKLEGSFTVPAGGVVEIKFGKLADFSSVNMISAGATISEQDNPINIFRFKKKEGIITEHELKVGNDDEMMDFIRWLFKASGFVLGFPPAPDIFVKIGALLMLKDARIPSTGQLVFEAFLNIFGGSGEDQKDYENSKNEQGPVPALFRFWIDNNANPDNWHDPSSDKNIRLPLGIKSELWYLPAVPEGGGSVETENILLLNQHDDRWFFFNGKPTGIRVGDWAAAKFKCPPNEERWYAVQIEDIKESLEEGSTGNGATIPPQHRHEHSSAFAIRLQELPERIADTFKQPNADNIPEMIELQADYRHEGKPMGAEINKATLEGPFNLTPSPRNLSIGHTMLAVNDKGDAEEVRIDKVTDDGGVVVNPPLGKPFNQGNLKLYGNVVRAGHGERQPTAVLGSGTGIQRLNHLILEQTEVSTVPDKRLDGGAREDLTVQIGEERWQQVSSFDQSTPGDRHFTVTTTEAGYLKLQFGDGRRGRSLPPGTQNVKVDYRLGAGQRGSLPPYSLEQLVQPHPLVKAVEQPTHATGGADMEPPEHIRERASASLLALGQAVSIGDFEQLAMQHRSIWQARAFYHIGGAGYRDRVKVVVALADGKALDDDLKDVVTEYLQKRAVPTVCVEAVNYERLDVSLSIDIRVDYATYDPADVVIAVRKKVAETFSVKQRRIHQPLYLSEIYAAVEKVSGVEDSTCAFTLDAASLGSPLDLDLSQNSDSIPKEGKSLVIVAKMEDGSLHFRVFDNEGKRVVDKQENGLTNQSEAISNLKKALADLWEKPETSKEEEIKIINKVISILDHNLSKQQNIIPGTKEIAFVPDENAVLCNTTEYTP